MIVCEQMLSGNNFILRGARVIDPFTGEDAVRDIGVMGGVLCDPADVLDPVTLDLSGLALSPGFIDIHVHLRQPGNTAAETIATGTMAAAAGGFTAILSMPNTSPACDNASTVEYLRRHTAVDAKVRVFHCGCLTRNYEGEAMAPIGSLKKAGVTALSDDGRCVQDHNLMRHIVQYAKNFDLPVLDHCEDNFLKSDGYMHEGKWSVLLGMKGMPSSAEELMVSRNIILAREIDWDIHIQHISALESVEAVRRARAAGIRITAEATPHHIALTDDYIRRYDTNYKMNPPLRTEEDRMAVIEALADGTVTVIATDHAPHTETSKLVEFDQAPFGIVGLETAFPVCMTELVHKGYLTLPQLISKLTKGPAEVLKLGNRSLEIGNPADITIFDPDAEYTIDKDKFFSLSRNTPFHGMTVKGKIRGTMVYGRLVYSDLAAGQQK